jgi:hypothetical protein
VGWPQPTEYNEAVQNPRHSFSDPELQGGQVVEDALGMPRPYSGNFADVYQVRGPGQAWAVKCFTREVPGLQARYQAISDHLAGGTPSFMVNFRYLVEGIRIGGSWYPILKMDWVEGFTLNEFVRKHVDKPPVMFKLASMWVKLSRQLRQARMAHADLQHGNVLLVPGDKTSQLSLRLIDYDGMHVPALARAPSGEVGHPNYQHPQRLREGIYSAEVDRFGHLVIYTALRCLLVGGRELWDRYDNGENLLFREQDFRNSQESKLLLDAWQLPDPDIRRLIGHLMLGSQTALEKVAMLDEVVGSEGRPLGLTTGQERELFDLLPPAAVRLKAAPMVVPRYSLEELLGESDDEPQGQPARGSAPVAVAELLAGVTAAVAAVAQDTSSQPKRRSDVFAPVDKSWWETGEPHPDRRPLLPWLRAACWHCREQVHLLESICPHCGRASFPVLLAAGALSLLCGAAAAGWLPLNQPGLAGIFGVAAALACVVSIPLSVVLLVQIIVRPKMVHGDAGGPYWPARQTPCVRCGRLQVMPLFICRNCGRMDWVKLAGLASALLTVLTLVMISQPHAEAAVWWVLLVRGLRWSGRLVGLVAGILLLTGIFEVWKLQGRLPREGRIRTSAETLALVAATLAPFLAAALLVFGLFSSVQSADPVDPKNPPNFDRSR